MSALKLSEIVAGTELYVRSDEAKHNAELARDAGALLARCHALGDILFNQLAEMRAVIKVDICRNHLNDKTNIQNTFQGFSLREMMHE